MELDPVDPRGHQGRIDDAVAAMKAPVVGPSVLVCRSPVMYLADMARATRVRLRALLGHGWTVVALDDGALPWRYGWTARELPVAHLHRHDGARRITLIPGRRGGQAIVLLPGPVPVATYGPEEVDDAGRAVLDRLLEEERVAASVTADAFAVPQLAHVEGLRLRDALASPDDDGWYGRVLGVLGMPVVAADVAEGRAELAGAVTVEPAGLGRTLVPMWDLYVDDAMRQGDHARGLKRWHATMVRYPVLMLLLVVAETVCGLRGAAWGAENWGGAYPVAVLAVSAIMLFDAVNNVATVASCPTPNPLTPPATRASRGLTACCSPSRPVRS